MLLKILVVMNETSISADNLKLEGVNVTLTKHIYMDIHMHTHVHTHSRIHVHTHAHM